MQKLVFLAALIAVVTIPSYAHNWVKAPPTRNGNTDSRISPCPPGNKTYSVVVRGSSLSVTYTQNHGLPEHEFKVVAAANEAAMTPATVSFSFPNGSGDATRSLAIPSNHALGDHAVQYKWGSYYNCFDLIVSDPSLTLVAGDTYRLADDKGTVDLKTMAYTCDDGSAPVDDPNRPGLKMCSTSGSTPPPPPPPPAAVTCVDNGLSTDADRNSGYCTAYDGKPNCCPKDTAPTKTDQSCATSNISSECVAQFEALDCGIQCSPNQLAFTVLSGNSPTYALCQSFADRIFASCKDAEIEVQPGQCLRFGNLYSDGTDFATKGGFTIGTAPNCFSAASTSADDNPTANACTRQFGQHILAMAVAVASGILLA